MSLQVEGVMPDGFHYEREQNISHGVYGGLELFILPMDAENQYQVQLYTDADKIENREGFFEYLETLHQRYPFVYRAGYNGSNMVYIYVTFREQEDKENLTTVVSGLASRCAEFGVRNCCAHCKKIVPLHAGAVDHTPLLICDNCLSRMTDSTDGKACRKENLPLGVAGAVVGALLGSVLWIVIGELGFIAGIAGYAIVFCGMKGYQILGGKISKAGIVICVLLSCLAIAGAEMVSLGFAIYQEFGEMYMITMGDAFRVIPEFLKEPEVIGGVAKDLLVGYALAVWASYAGIRSAWQQVGKEPEQHTVVRF
ncbi:MAG: hypothetical protein HFI88_05905 [Lachnospiraceae bacterium]|nr:hypothetical protein [Lachnospiraceae bacterium]